MLVDQILPPFLFVFGAVIGSFLNVVILRSIQQKSLTGRSACPQCHHTLRWWELIPIISFIMLRGRCAQCNKEISIQYPLVEFAFGSIVLLLAWPLPLTIIEEWVKLLLVLSAAALLVVLFVVDLKTMILPDRFIVILSVVIVFLHILKYLTPTPLLIQGEGNGRGEVADALYGILIGAGFLLFLWLSTKGRGIGLGDVKLMIPLGVWFGAVNTTILLFIAFTVGGLVGSLLLLRGKASLKTAIPFGPFLCGTALLLILVPQLPARLLELLWYN